MSEALQASQPSEAHKRAQRSGSAARKDSISSTALAEEVGALVLDMKAENVVEIGVKERSSYADYLVIASGHSDRHVQAIANKVASALKERHGLEPLGKEGLREGQWALVDFGDVVLHVFHEFTRDLYRIEDLWPDAPRRVLSSEPSTENSAHA